MPSIFSSIPVVSIHCNWFVCQCHIYVLKKHTHTHSYSLRNWPEKVRKECRIYCSCWAIVRKFFTSVLIQCLFKIFSRFAPLVLFCLTSGTVFSPIAVAVQRSFVSLKGLPINSDRRRSSCCVLRQAISLRVLINSNYLVCLYKTG